MTEQNPRHAQLSTRYRFRPLVVKKLKDDTCANQGEEVSSSTPYVPVRYCRNDGVEEPPQ